MISYQFSDVAVEEHNILYCSLGKSREDIAVKDLITTNYDLERVTKGPNDRYNYNYYGCNNILDTEGARTVSSQEEYM